MAPHPPTGGVYELVASCFRADGQGGYLWASESNRSANGNSLWHDKSPEGYWRADFAVSGEATRPVEVIRAHW